MNLRSAWLPMFCLALVSVPAFAQWAYDNGPINGGVDAWTINYGYIVSDTFTAGGSAVGGFSFGVWEYPGDVVESVDWSITSSENSGTVYGSGTASGNNLTDTFISTNSYGFDIDKIAVTGLSVAEIAGTKYWLNLQNAVTKEGEPLYWDENSGVGCGGYGCPSQASESSVGSMASEAFTIDGACGAGKNSPSCTPEPSSVMLFGSGILGVVCALRRKMNF